MINSHEAIRMVEDAVTAQMRGSSGNTSLLLAYEEVIRLAKFGMAMERSLHKYLDSFVSVEEMGFGDPAVFEKPLIDAKPSRLPRKMRKDFLKDIEDVISQGVPVKKKVMDA